MGAPEAGVAQLCRAGWSQPEAGNDWVLPRKSHLFHAALPCQQHFNNEADLSHTEHPKLSLPQAQTAAAPCFPNPQLQLQNPCSADCSRAEGFIMWMCCNTSAHSTGGASVSSSEPYLLHFIHFCCFTISYN